MAVSPACTIASDCGISTDCISFSCDEGVCVTDYAVAGTTCPFGFCDGLGSCSWACLQSSDCVSFFADGSACYFNPVCVEHGCSYAQETCSASEDCTATGCVSACTPCTPYYASLIAGVYFDEYYDCSGVDDLGCAVNALISDCSGFDTSLDSSAGEQSCGVHCGDTKCDASEITCIWDPVNNLCLDTSPKTNCDFDCGLCRDRTVDNCEN